MLTAPPQQQHPNHYKFGQRDRACLACYRLLLLLRPVAPARAHARGEGHAGAFSRPPRARHGYVPVACARAREREREKEPRVPWGFVPTSRGHPPLAEATRRGVTHAGAQARKCFWLGVPAGPGTGNISPGDPCGWPCTPPLRFSVTFPCSWRGLVAATKHSIPSVSSCSLNTAPAGRSRHCFSYPGYARLGKGN
jgi:hypothetical protein